VDHEILPDKTIISYWWKKLDLLLQHQIKQVVNPEDLHGLQRVDICTGGDHGVCRFRMLLKILFCFMDKPPITRLFEIANILHSQDGIGILNRIVLQKFSDGYGDLKYFAQMLGHDGMNTSWCMWCQAHPNEWKGLFSVPVHQLWSIAAQVEYVQRIEAGVLKEPKEKKVLLLASN
jgi:hypothetical protein